MNFKVTLNLDLESCESEEQAYEALLEYLAQCVQNGDVTAFDFTPQP